MTENFSNIKDILKGVQFRSVNPVFAQVISQWDDIVGKKFKGKTQLVDISFKGNKLFLSVHVKSSPLVQELTFFKKNILQKVKTQYGLEVFDMLIKVANDMQTVEKKAKQNLVLEVYEERPTEEELKNIELDKKIVAEMAASVENQPSLTEEQKTRMLNVILNDLKTQEWMKKKGFPVCEKCGRVLTRKNFGDENLCRFCKEQIT